MIQNNCHSPHSPNSVAPIAGQVSRHSVAPVPYTRAGRVTDCPVTGPMVSREKNRASESTESFFLEGRRLPSIETCPDEVRTSPDRPDTSAKGERLARLLATVPGLVTGNGIPNPLLYPGNHGKSGVFRGSVAWNVSEKHGKNDIITTDRGLASSAPLGNTNAVRHGQRSKRHGLVHAKLGRRFASAYGHCNSLRKAVEGLIRQQHGSITLVEQARVQSLLRLEEGIRAVEKMMADNPSMGPEEVRSNRAAIAQWTLTRDNILAELVGNGKATTNPWDLLNAVRAQPAVGQADAAGEAVGPPEAQHAADFGIETGGGQ